MVKACFLDEIKTFDALLRSRVKTTAFYKDCPILENGTMPTSCKKTYLKNSTTVIRSCGLLPRTNETDAIQEIQGIDLSCGCMPGVVGCNVSVCNCFSDGCNGSETSKSFSNLILIFIFFIGLVFNLFWYCFEA